MDQRMESAFSPGRRKSGWTHWLGLPLALGCWLVAMSAATASQWETLENCSQSSWDGNDGDSFLIKCPELKAEKVFRLYYVDTPESEESLPERLEEQRLYWDLPNVQAVVKCGKKASHFTSRFLSGHFQVHTRWESAMGRTKMGRTYAMLSLDGIDLGYALVRNGLARVHGKGPDLEGLPGYHSASANAWWEKLRQAEAFAKREKKGCWAYSGSQGVRHAAEDLGADDDLPPEEDGMPFPHRPGQPGMRNRITAGPSHRVPLPAYQGMEPRSPAAPVRPAPVPVTYPLDRVTSAPLNIYSLHGAPGADPVGRLKAGMTVRVLEDAGAGRVRVRFTLSSGKVYEGAARKADLGLE